MRGESEARHVRSFFEATPQRLSTLSPPRPGLAAAPGARRALSLASRARPSSVTLMMCQQSSAIIIWHAARLTAVGHDVPAELGHHHCGAAYCAKDGMSDQILSLTLSRQRKRDCVGWPEATSARAFCWTVRVAFLWGLGFLAKNGGGSSSTICNGPEPSGIFSHQTRSNRFPRSPARFSPTLWEQREQTKSVDSVSWLAMPRA